MRNLVRFLVLLVFSIPAFAFPAAAWAGGGVAEAPIQARGRGASNLSPSPERGSAGEAAAYAEREAAAPLLEEFRGGRENVDPEVLKWLIIFTVVLLVVLIVVIVLV